MRRGDARRRPVRAARPHHARRTPSGRRAALGRGRARDGRRRGAQRPADQPGRPTTRSSRRRSTSRRSPRTSGAFDAAWMERTFDNFWRGWAQWATAVDQLLAAAARGRTSAPSSTPRPGTRRWPSGSPPASTTPGSSSRGGSTPRPRPRSSTEQRVVEAVPLRRPRPAPGARPVRHRGHRRHHRPTPTGRPFGMTANSFTSVSINPPLVLWAAAGSSPSLAVFEASGPVRGQRARLRPAPPLPAVLDLRAPTSSTASGCCRRRPARCSRAPSPASSAGAPSASRPATTWCSSARSSPTTPPAASRWSSTPASTASPPSTPTSERPSADLSHCLPGSAACRARWTHLGSTDSPVDNPPRGGTTGRVHVHSHAELPGVLPPRRAPVRRTRSARQPRAMDSSGRRRPRRVPSAGRTRCAPATTTPRSGVRCVTGCGGGSGSAPAPTPTCWPADVHEQHRVCRPSRRASLRASGRAQPRRRRRSSTALTVWHADLTQVTSPATTASAGRTEAGVVPHERPAAASDLVAAWAGSRSRRPGRPSRRPRPCPPRPGWSCSTRCCACAFHAHRARGHLPHDVQLAGHAAHPSAPLADGRAESAGESVMRLLWLDAGLPGAAAAVRGARPDRAAGRHLRPGLARAPADVRVRRPHQVRAVPAPGETPGDAVSARSAARTRCARPPAGG